MNDLFKKYPLPWEMMKTLHGECLKAANGKVVIAEHKTLYIRNLLEVLNDSIETETDDLDDKIDKLFRLTKDSCDCYGYLCNDCGEFIPFQSYSMNNQQHICSFEKSQISKDDETIDLLKKIVGLLESIKAFGIDP